LDFASQMGTLNVYLTVGDYGFAHATKDGSEDAYFVMMKKDADGIWRIKSF
jgi:hypothetical protein